MWKYPTRRTADAAHRMLATAFACTLLLSVIANAQTESASTPSEHHSWDLPALHSDDNDAKEAAEFRTVRAWEAMISLTPAQQRLVSDDLARLKPAYIEAAVQLAGTLTQEHMPIRSIADEVAIENACNYLQDAWQLSGNTLWRDQHQQLASQMSDYLFDLAKRYLNRPGNSGIELAWMYLTEASSYHGTNFKTVHEAMTAASAAHELHSRLAIRVQLSNQTAQPETSPFVTRMEEAMRSALQEARIPVQVVSGDAPDFLLRADLLRHSLTMTPSELAGRNPDTPPQTSYAQLSEAANDPHVAQNSDLLFPSLHVNPRLVATDVSYSAPHARRSVTLSGSIRMQFRLVASGEESSAISIRKEEEKHLTMPQAGESTDANSFHPVREANSFMSTLEDSALKDLLSALRKQVENLPSRLSQKAMTSEEANDLDAAGEAWLRYLRLVPASDAPEQRHARLFLLEQFNMTPQPQTEH